MCPSSRPTTASAGWPRCASWSTPSGGVGRYRTMRSSTLAAEHADVLIPFVSIDPHRPDAADEARRLIAEHAVRGFKFHPSLQAFFPDDRLAYPLYEVIAEHGLPAVFHTGQTAVGSGLRGGGGVLLKYSNPLHLDEVAADFPDMPVIMAHPSVPWQDEALSVAVHKPNVWIDLSGWSPKYFPPQLVRYANSLLREKVLFGTRLPRAHPGALAARLRRARHQGRGAAADPQGERAEAARAVTVLWEPRGDSAVERFAAAHGHADYGSLFRWSVADLEGFWQAVWDHFGLRAHTPARRVLGRREMPGRRVVPGRAAQLRRAPARRRRRGRRARPLQHPRAAAADVRRAGRAGGPRPARPAAARRGGGRPRRGLSAQRPGGADRVPGHGVARCDLGERGARVRPAQRDRPLRPAAAEGAAGRARLHLPRRPHRPLGGARGHPRRAARAGARRRGGLRRRRRRAGRS